MVLDYKNAKEKLLVNSDLNCRQFFIKNGYILESGYAFLLNEELNEAKKMFEYIEETDIRAHWGLFLISMISDDVGEYPTYFELRNFLEIDLNILINNFKGDYVEKIIRYADFMFTINPEVHKFIGRVFYNNGLKEQAMFFLNRAKSYFYNDPELHYLISYIYYNDRDYVEAKNAAKDCLRVLPEYFPALNMIDKIDKSFAL